MTIPPKKPPARLSGPGGTVPPDLKFQAFGDVVTLDAELLKAAMALLYGQQLPPALCDLLGSNPQIDATLQFFIVNYPAPIACAFSVALGYLLHAGAEKQFLARSRTTIATPGDKVPPGGKPQ